MTDLLIIGGGNAALCAAISAARAGIKDIVILEAAPKDYRGGNSRHTRNFRVRHQGALGVLTDTYDTDEFYDDLLKVTKGNTDPDLARFCIEQSTLCYPWMVEQGLHFQPSLSGTLSLSRTNAFFLGGGKALVNAYYRTAERLGVKVHYQADVSHIELDQGQVVRVDYELDGREHRVSPRAVVVASGGFESNIDWLAEAWGPAARNFLIRGTPYNQGRVLKDLVAQDVETVGDPTQMHSVAIDGRAPKFDGGIVTRLDCVPFSVVLNANGQRFYDEGEDVWPKRYAIWGRLVASQPDQVGYVIIDSCSLDLFMPSVFPPAKADTLEDLVTQMGLPADQALASIAEFNRACGNNQEDFHPQQLDGVSTHGLEPKKSNWARPIVEPPFYGYTLRPGVTFTYLGLKVDKTAQVQSPRGAIKNMWAAGEIMAGSILGEGYLAGFGMTIGTVFGRIAGQQAAEYLG